VASRVLLAKLARPCTARDAAFPASLRRTGDPKTIDETAEMINAAGGTAIPVRVDHGITAAELWNSLLTQGLT
jgi:hypothetical protein